jgi:penicillin-binding protein 2
VFDYWLLGHYPSEEDMAATQKGQSASPIGKPRAKSEVPLMVPKTLNAGQTDQP